MTDMPNAGPLHRPLIKLGGTPISTELSLAILDCRVELALNRPGQATLRFLDEEFKLVDDTKFAIGTQIEVGFGAVDGDVEPVFKGEIISVGVESGAHDEPVMTLTAFDGSYKLARNSRAKVWANQTYSDVLRAMAGTAGLSFDSPALSQTYVHLLQTMDDAAMLDHIMAQTGLAWYVKAGKLTVVKPALGTEVTTLMMRADLRKFRAVASATDAGQEITVKGWDSKTKAAVVGTSTTTDSLTTAPLGTSARSKAKQNYASKRVALGTRALSAAEAKLIADSYAVRSAFDELTIRGEADGNPKVLVGTTVKVAGVGTNLSGKYFITAVDHIYTGRDFRTRFTSGAFRPSHLVDLLGGGTGGAAGSWHLRGPAIGIVSDVGKDTNDGKVKVKLPSQDDTLVTDWARLAAPGAGNTRGLYLMPNIDDEVLVVFEDGDTRRPVVIGSLWNGKDKVPDALPVKNGQPQEWLLKSRLGNTIRVRDGDAENEQNVEIALKDQNIKLYIGMDKIELIGKQGKTMEFKIGDASITFNANGDIDVKANKINMTATADLAVKGMNVKVNADAQITAKGAAGVEIGGPKVKIAGDGMTEISGGIVKIN
ncbi:MAG: phage baseplate assembly protein V [Ilumatobacteraceae bacterium]